MTCNTNSEALHSHGHPPSSPPRTTWGGEGCYGPGRINHEGLLREDRLLGLYPRNQRNCGTRVRNNDHVSDRVSAPVEPQ